ncbi:hypothetical protein RSAG8_01086, partial [Rhizoctonia solani AG-8 WAC10335]
MLNLGVNQPSWRKRSVHWNESARLPGLGTRAVDR